MQSASSSASDSSSEAEHVRDSEEVRASFAKKMDQSTAKDDIL